MPGSCQSDNCSDSTACHRDATKDIFQKDSERDYSNAYLMGPPERIVLQHLVLLQIGPNTPALVVSQGMTIFLQMQTKFNQKAATKFRPKARNEDLPERVC